MTNTKKGHTHVCSICHEEFVCTYVSCDDPYDICMIYDTETCCDKEECMKKFEESLEL